jgi:hypothetical protein
MCYIERFTPMTCSLVGRLGERCDSAPACRPGQTDEAFMTYDNEIMVETEGKWTSAAATDDDDDLFSSPVPALGALEAHNKRYFSEAADRFTTMLAHINNLHVDGVSEVKIVEIVAAEYCDPQGDSSVVEPLSELRFPPAAMRERAKAMLAVCQGYAHLWEGFCRDREAQEKAKAKEAWEAYAGENGYGLTAGEKSWRRVVFFALLGVLLCGYIMREAPPSPAWGWIGLILGAGFFALGLGHIFWSWRKPEGRTNSSLFVVLLVLGVAALLGLVIYCGD